MWRRIAVVVVCLALAGCGTAQAGADQSGSALTSAAGADAGSDAGNGAGAVVAGPDTAGVGPVRGGSPLTIDAISATPGSSLDLVVSQLADSCTAAGLPSSCAGLPSYSEIELETCSVTSSDPWIFQGKARTISLAGPVRLTLDFCATDTSGGSGSSSTTTSVTTTKPPPTSTSGRMGSSG